jgi:hypothetical protein
VVQDDDRIGAQSVGDQFRQPVPYTKETEMQTSPTSVELMAEIYRQTLLADAGRTRPKTSRRLRRARSLAIVTCFRSFCGAALIRAGERLRGTPRHPDPNLVSPTWPVHERVNDSAARTVRRATCDNSAARASILMWWSSAWDWPGVKIDPGLILELFELKRPNFSDEYEEAIEQRQIAEVLIEQRRQETLVAGQEAGRARVQAQGEAQSLAETGQAVRANPEILELERVRAIVNANVDYIPNDGILPVLDVSASQSPTSMPTSPAEPEPTPTQTP